MMMISRPALRHEKLLLESEVLSVKKMRRPEEESRENSEEDET